MFIKQLKNDLLFSRDAFFGMGALLLGVALIIRIADANFDIIESIPFLEVMIFLILGVSITTVVFASIYQLFTFYRRNFFGNSGYLMLTLPVSRGVQLASKLIVSLIWINFMLLVGIAMVWIITFNVGTPEQEFVVVSFASYGARLAFELIIAFVVMNLFFLLIMATTYLGITLANSTIGRWRIHGIAAGIVSILYLVLTFVAMYGVVRLFTSAGITVIGTLEAVLNFGTLGVFATGAIAATYYLLKNRVDLR